MTGPRNKETPENRAPVGVISTDEPGLGYQDFVLLTVEERNAFVAALAERDRAVEALREIIDDLSHRVPNDNSVSDAIDKAREALRDRPT